MSASCSRALEMLPDDEAAARAHASGCASCAEIVEAWRAAEAVPVPALDERFRERVRATALHELKLTPNAGSWRTPALVVGGGAAFLALLMTFVIPRSKNLTIASMVAALAFTAFLMGVQLFAGWWALKPRLGRLHLVAFGLSVAAMLALLLAPGLSSSGAVEGARQSSCLKVQIGLALLPTVIGLLALRHNAPSMLRGALVGVAAGLAGTIPLYWHCANLSAGHLGAFHLGGWALAVLVAAAAARLLKPRAWAP